MCIEFNLNQIGLVLGFIGSVLLFFSMKVGTIMFDGRIRFDDLDDMSPVKENEKKVHSSHWRNKYFTPSGWFCLASSFLLQFIAGFN